jgi:hypothetical protein
MHRYEDNIKMYLQKKKAKRGLELDLSGSG